MRKNFTCLERATRITTEYDLPDRYRELFSLTDEHPISVQGAGLSYVAASFSETSRTVGLGRFNRIIEFNAEEGFVKAEAGITIGKLFEFLAPHGFHLAVQPGHPQISLGGCVAANVHGKNQPAHGLFSEWVEAIELFHPSHGVLNLSSTENQDLFDLTCGGYGLTGIILTVRFRVLPLPAKSVEVSHLAVPSLPETFSFMKAVSADNDMVYSWNDLSKPSRNGRGFLIVGRFKAGQSTGPNSQEYKQMNPHCDRKWRLPLFGGLTAPWINLLYHGMATSRSRPLPQSMFDYLFPAASRSAYFDWYGNDGFLEHKTLIPEDAVPDYLKDLRRLQEKMRQPVVLTSAKLFRGEQRLLHYNGAGLSLTLDLKRSNQAIKFLDALDEVDCAHGCIANVIMDSRLKASVIASQYPEYELFRERLTGFDKQRVFVSALSQRLEL